MSGRFLSLELRVCVLAAIVFAPAAIASDPAVDVVSQDSFASAMAPVTLRELPPAQPVFHPIHEDRRRIVERESKTAFATSVLPPATVPSIVAPPLTAQFTATYDVDQGYPSDANGAVGPKHLLSVSIAAEKYCGRTSTTVSGAIRLSLPEETSTTHAPRTIPSPIDG